MYVHFHVVIHEKNKKKIPKKQLKIEMGQHQFTLSKNQLKTFILKILNKKNYCFDSISTGPTLGIYTYIHLHIEKKGEI